MIPGTVQTCAGVLREGNSLAISPGGVYEAQFGDHYYRLNWKSRIGFAKVAQEAKVVSIGLLYKLAVLSLRASVTDRASPQSI